MTSEAKTRFTLDTFCQSRKFSQISIRGMTDDVLLIYLFKPLISLLKINECLLSYNKMKNMLFEKDTLDFQMLITFRM